MFKSWRWFEVFNGHDASSLYEKLELTVMWMYKGADWLLDQGVPVGSEEVPGQFVAMWVPGDRHDHVREVLGLHHLTMEALLHDPADKNKGKEKTEQNIGENNTREDEERADREGNW